jgi:hypothetical protein
MKILIYATVLAVGTMFAQSASAATRLEEGMMGAAAGALVGGPVGLAAGGAIGYTRGHSIAHGIFHGRHYYWRNWHRYYYYH